MERRSNVNVGLAVIAAAAVGFAVALVAFGGNENNAAVTTTSATTTSGTQVAPSAPTGSVTTPTATATTPTATAPSTATTPQATAPTPASCVALWNQPANRGAQTFLVNIASQQPVRVHAGAAAGEPTKCLVTVVANSGDAFLFPEGGGTTYPYAPLPTKTSGSSLPADQKTENALEQRDGTLEAR